MEKETNKKAKKAMKKLKRKFAFAEDKPLERERLLKQARKFLERW